MAKIYEEMVVIKLSKLVKNGEDEVDALASSDTLAALEQVAQELVGEHVVVEIERN